MSEKINPKLSQEKLPKEQESSLPEDQEESILPQELTAQSLICDDCGKLLRDASKAEFHAIKTAHQNFSESTKEIKPLTEQEKGAKLKELERRLAERREEKRLAQIEEDKRKESVRRANGIEMQLIREKMEKEQIAKDAELRRRQKEEDLQAKNAIRKQLELDKLERQKEAEERKKRAQGIAQPTPQIPISQSQKDYSETRIQIRIPNKSPITNVFNANDKLSTVFEFVKQHYSGPFKLIQNFPKMVLSDAESEKTLKQLNLVPSAALILQ
jgi:hypothetical protein